MQYLESLKNIIMYIILTYAIYIPIVDLIAVSYLLNEWTYDTIPFKKDISLEKEKYRIFLPKSISKELIFGILQTIALLHRDSTFKALKIILKVKTTTGIITFQNIINVFNNNITDSMTNEILKTIEEYNTIEVISMEIHVIVHGVTAEKEEPKKIDYTSKNPTLSEGFIEISKETNHLYNKIIELEKVLLSKEWADKSLESVLIQIKLKEEIKKIIRIKESIENIEKDTNK